MKITAVACPCGNPYNHKKLQVEDGRESYGFFSLRQGRAVLKMMVEEFKALGTINPEEIKSAEESLANCGLNESLSDTYLQDIANTLAKSQPLDAIRFTVTAVVETGNLSQEEASKFIKFAEEAKTKL